MKLNNKLKTKVVKKIINEIIEEFDAFFEERDWDSTIDNILLDHDFSMDDEDLMAATRLIKKQVIKTLKKARNEQAR